MFGRNKNTDERTKCTRGCGRFVLASRMADHFIYAHLNAEMGASEVTDMLKANRRFDREQQFVTLAGKFAQE